MIVPHQLVFYFFSDLKSKRNHKARAKVKDVTAKKQLKPRKFSRFGSAFANAMALNLPGPYTCDICSSVINNRHNFHIHMKRSHLAVYVYCDHCPRRFSRKFELQIHMHKHSKTKSLLCQTCGFETGSRPVLKHHLLTHNKKVECPVCHKFVAVLKQHIKLHDDKIRAIRNEKVLCKLCSKLVPRRNQKQHFQLKHQKNEQCKHCVEAFETRTLLRQ